MKRSMTSTLRIAGATAAALIFTTIGATAATLTQADLPYGQFSASVSDPTVIGAGVTDIEGSTAAGQVVSLRFTDLLAGAQELTFAFSIDADLQGPSNGWQYFGAGGNLRYSVDAPFVGNSYTGGATFGQYSVNNTSVAALTDTVTLSLDDSFAGDLYVVINTTFGSLPIDFHATATSALTNDALLGQGSSSDDVLGVAPIPLPSSSILLLAGIAGLTLRARRRKG